MNDLEQAVRQTLSARVSHLTDERLDADVAVPAPPRRTLRAVVLPLAAAATVAAVTVGVVLGVSHHGKSHPVATPTLPGPQLVGTEWQLESIGARPTPDDVDAVIRFDGKGKTSGNDGCNYVGGSAEIDGSTLKITQEVTTLAGCIGDRFEVERDFTAALKSIDHWAIGGGTLRLTGADGTVMTFHVRSSTFPGKDVTPLAQGKRGEGDYRFGYSRAGQVVGLDWEWRAAPGQGWDQSGLSDDDVTALEPNCNRVDGSAAFVYGWVTTGAAEVVYGGTTPVDLKLYPISGAQGTAFGGFVDHARTHTPVTVYGADGHVLARATSLYCD